MMNETIQQLLAKQQEQASEVLKTSGMAEQLEISEYNNTRIIELQNAVKEVLEASDTPNKGVWQEFSFGSVCGAILGLLKTAFLHSKERNKICSTLGISTMLVDMYYNIGGRSPYVKDGKIQEAVPADLPKLKELVFITGSKLGIVVSKSDLEMINTENEARRNELQEQRSNDYINMKFEQNININPTQEVNSFEEMLKTM